MSPSAALCAPPGKPKVFVEFKSAAWRNAGFDATGLCQEAAFEAVAATPELAGNVEISIVLANDDFVRSLNKTWRNIDVPTNVLAFPCFDEDESSGPGAERLLGDVIVAFQTTRREAVDLQLPLAHHLAHLIVHGVLHLLGHDHMDDEDAAIMEKLEIMALGKLGIANPYEEAAPTHE